MNRRTFLRNSAIAMAGLPLAGSCGDASDDLGFTSDQEKFFSSEDNYRSIARQDGFPNRLFVIHELQITKAEFILLVTLQGLVSRGSSDRIWIQSQSWIQWTRYLSQEFSVPFIRLRPVGRFLIRFRHLIHGYVLYDSRRNPASRNAAISAAGLFNAIAVDRSIESRVRSFGFRRILNVSFVNENWVWNRYNRQFNHDYLIEQHAGTRGFLSDFVVYQKAFAFHDGEERSRLVNLTLRAQNPGSYLFGWRGCEYDFFTSASEMSVVPVPGADMPNLSVLSQMKTGPLKQNNRTARFAFDQNKHYVAFLVVDGDNIEWFYHMFATPIWWGHPSRGQFPINWEISPSLFTFAGPIMKYFYQRASAADYFVSSSSGTGSIFPQRFSDLPSYMETLNPVLKDTDLQVVTVYEPDSLDLKSAAPFTEMSSVEGVIFKTYLGNYHLLQGVEFENDVPIKSCDFALWNDDETGVSLARAINRRPRNPRQDPQSYSIVVVHPWTVNVMDEMQIAVNRFNRRVKVVSCREMFYHLRHNFDRSHAGAAQCQNLPPSIQLPELSRDPFRSLHPSCQIVLDPCQFDTF